MLGLGYSRASAGAVSKNQDKNWGRYDSKTGAGRLQVTHAPSYQISSMERRVVEISQNINPFQSALSLSLSLSTRPGLIKKSIFLISFPIDVWEWVQFPKSKILVFCECSEVGLIGKLDLQKGRVFGLNNQSSDRHRDITTQNTTFITRNCRHKLGVHSPTNCKYQPERISSSERIFSVFRELVRAII